MATPKRGEVSPAASISADPDCPMAVNGASIIPAHSRILIALI
jgi:hypothetical protein